MSEQPDHAAGARTSARRAGLVAAVLLGGFALCAALTVGRAPGWFDRWGFSRLYSGESDWAHGPTPGRDDPTTQAIMEVLMRLNDDREITLILALLLAGLVLTRRVRAALFVVAGVAVTLAADPLKGLFGRESPFPLPDNASFPSGHGTATAALAAVIVVLAWGTRWRLPAVAFGGVLVVATGLAVIGDGGHWPTDVLAGWMLAGGWVMALAAGAAALASDGSIGPALRRQAGRPARARPDAQRS